MSKVVELGTPVFPNSPGHKNDLGHVLEVQGHAHLPPPSLNLVCGGAEESVPAKRPG